MDAIWILMAVFCASLAGVLYLRRGKSKKEEVGAQFVITGTLLLIFYLVCFCSGICTIFNFLFRWVL